MMFPSGRSDGGASFIDFLASRISSEELEAFLVEFGFVAPNCFDPGGVRKILTEGRYPKNNLRELGWAVYECGIERVRSYSAGIRIFASSVYVYARHVEEWGGDWQGEFCHLMIAGSMRSGAIDELRALVVFLEWLCSCVSPANQANDFPLLLSWLLIKCRLGESQSDIYRHVFDQLSLRVGQKYLLYGDSVDFGESDWLSLVDLIPDSVGADKESLWDLICK